MLQVHPIFQTPIMVVELDGLCDALDLETWIRARCAETKGTFGPGEVVQSRYDLNHEPHLRPLCESIFQVAYATIREVYRYDPEYVVEMTTMWGNIQRPGAAFRTHVHYNCIFSGVFFVTEHPDFPPITFWRPQETTLDPRKTQFNIFNQGSFTWKVKKDTLILFPSWLQHSVDVNPTTEDRVGVSFNLLLRGDYYNTRL